MGLMKAVPSIAAGIIFMAIFIGGPMLAGWLGTLWVGPLP